MDHPSLPPCPTTSLTSWNLLNIFFRIRVNLRRLISDRVSSIPGGVWYGMWYGVWGLPQCRAFAMYVACRRGVSPCPPRGGSPWRFLCRVGFTALHRVVRMSLSRTLPTCPRQPPLPLSSTRPHNLWALEAHQPSVQLLFGECRTSGSSHAYASSRSL